jgi:NADH-quinone oxidoreductase subunit H
MNVITMSGVMVTLFLGGPQGLFDIPVIPGYVEGSIWFVAKLLLFLYMFVWFRATLPRLRYDQLMDFGWKILIPVSLGWFLVLAALRQFANGDNVASLRVVGIASLIGVIAVGLFAAALNVSRKNREASSSLSPVPSPSASSKGAAN